MSPEKLSVTAALIATIASALVIFSERAFPFVLFSRKSPPSIIRFIEKYIPPMVMAALLFYCLKNLSVTELLDSGERTITLNKFLPDLSALTLTVLLHLWKNNSLLSIFGGTALYMFLSQIL